MRPAPRAWALFGALPCLALVVIYLAWPGPSVPRGDEMRRAASAPAMQVDAAPVPVPVPAPAPAPTAAPQLPPEQTGVPGSALTAPEFEKPASPELYWRELERIEHGDEERALAYALAGDDWYPDVGRPAEARRAKIVTLLVNLRRMGEARERARSFIEKYPLSPYRRLVQGATGIHPRPGRPPRSAGASPTEAGGAE